MKAQAFTQAIPLSRPRWVDFVEMTKPRIAVLVLFTVAIGGLLATSAPDWRLLFHAVVGAALVASGASVLNQWLERHTDALMRRTEHRPLPAGRLTGGEVLVFGLLLGIGGLVYLGVSCRTTLAMTVAGVTFFSYVFIYTPLKRYSTFNTIVGAIPGALPPVIGWTAMTDRLDVEALLIALVIFIWQVPHFLAIAWMYREDYARAGLRMLPCYDQTGDMTARQMVLYCLTLIPVSLLPVLRLQAGWIYAIPTLLLGLWFLQATRRFQHEKSRDEARRVMLVSLAYLPGVLLMLVLDSYIRF